MSDVVACPSCTTLFTVSAELRGQTVHCKHCGNPLTLPSEVGTAHTSVRPPLELGAKEPAPRFVERSVDVELSSDVRIRGRVVEADFANPEPIYSAPQRFTAPPIRPLIRPRRLLSHAAERFDDQFAHDLLVRRAGYVIALMCPAAWIFPIMGIQWRLIPWVEYGSIGMVISSMALCWIGVCLVLYANMGLRPEDEPERVFRWSTPRRLLWVLGGTTGGVAVMTMLFAMVAARFESPRSSLAMAERIHILSAPAVPAALPGVIPEPTTMPSAAENIVQSPAEKDASRARAEASYRELLSKGLANTQIVRIIVKGGYPTVVQAVLEDWAAQNIEGTNSTVVVTDYGADQKMLIAASILDLPDKDSIGFGKITEIDEAERIVYVEFRTP